MPVSPVQLWEELTMELSNQQILDCLEKGAPFALAAILSHQGSTPRTSGSRMVVMPDGTLLGTIGGGLVEAKVKDACLTLIREKTCQIQSFFLDQELKGSLDMVCGGRLTVLMETLVPGPELISVFQALVAQEQAGQKGVLVSKLSGPSQGEFTVQKSLVLPDGTVTGACLIPKPLLEDICDDRFSGRFPTVHSLNLEEFIIQPMPPADTLFIFGAGHVGFVLAQLAHLTGFSTVVMDDREAFANKNRFPQARQVRVARDYDDAFKGLNVDSHSYIVILTRGHLHDQTVLEQALFTDPAYIGMIGSRTKRDRIYDNLMAKGISKERLNSVYSPVGLSIGAQTPAEIGVSIMAQIIQIRQGGPV
ncbi:putative xanthine and CO dehydrogenases maturation factor, XdhC/CoxF family [Desulfotignum phosphitoxidans DSM 13687]|jgi:xanthine dehydrogenase accessory factor|uniref:Putative xanthine and CO dehydrogenases maturation factor, XdhC/CoxF family n=2 Tax=Desulfotignum phosphitoxidans TaxID=190898 RepID=S0FS91_9BACT|nr:putative xanthine and CO dehydrogenases maturation factor, XdhC/CoxF family [Desulfotignum phosphitoxidans DSM 13687]